ncbi:MAG: aminoacetone oxidase family FAD-binding enzyme [Parcubacteria group bacterium CG08_land_8_20_14_0_20_43_9]|nr:MAG: aminoacetone oxidase family FAD-binding enzyme [Parcubacteria group bacterium CG08_land_8_20_14_0_20_43_9]
MNKKEEVFDVAVVGAGPAGMIAAGRAGELGAKVILLEKNKKPGRKLILTGKGRCNLTNAEFNLGKLVEHYGKNGKFLFHSFSVFGPQKVIDFFEKLGVKTKIERGRRVFPESDQADDVLRALIKGLLKGKVKIAYNSEVVGVNCKKNRIAKLILEDREIIAKKYIFCTGGKSCPVTGSTGDGFRWAKELGHKIEELSPALVPIKVKESWAWELRGLALKNVEVSVWQDGKKQCSRFGECLFTHFGLSGPIVLDISKRVGELLERGKVKIVIDLKPALDLRKLDERTKRDFQKYQNKSFKNSLNDLLPRNLIGIIVRMSKINPEKKANSVTKEERRYLAKILKNLEMTAVGLLDFDSAIITKGGVSLKEIDSRTMKSKIIDNLFFAGEIIDIDGPTGGFNLQSCWSTGFLAGESAGKKI